MSNVDWFNAQVTRWATRQVLYAFYSRLTTIYGESQTRQADNVPSCIAYTLLERELFGNSGLMRK
eukprot:6150372-Pleurochrysis_carterae.AAC.1